ncbi:MAG: hypothetical protein P1U56_11955 [Saprospiraceae bacterium]|nr:hypothetical protein [Saprospiraceae bacterium]
MKYLYICIIGLIHSTTFVAQDAPDWTYTEACVDQFTGILTIDLLHDLDEYPLPCNAEYYNETTGAYGEFVIHEATFIIDEFLITN